MQERIECLVIDDDQDDQEIFLMCVKKISSNIFCTNANDGTEAISMLTLRPEYIPDYIFLDVNMPKMNGITCLKILKVIDRLKKTKIYMYSTTSGESTVAASKELGADDFIIKPSRTVELKERLEKIFKIVSEQ